jgi:hypothetical protein
VVFTIFGSLVKLTSEQLAELDWVLASSGYEFLRVIRSDQQAMGAPGATTIVLPLEFLAEMEGRGRVTSWCLQEAVLWHKAVSAFLMHCGWNSILDCQCATVRTWSFTRASSSTSSSRLLLCTLFFLGSGSFIGNEMHTAICQGAVHFTTNLKIGLTRGGINDHVW